MPSNSKLFVKPFIGGLNTELSSVEDAILHTSDELNCTILPEGMRGRRLGFNIERDGRWIEANPSTSYSGYVWKNVNKTGQNILVQQVGTTLYFFADNKPFTGDLTNQYTECDLSKYTRNISNNEIGPLNYAIGDGFLYVVNDNIKPLRIIASSEDNGQYSFKPEEFTLYIRDLDGVEDGLNVDEMPSGKREDSDDTYDGLTPEHFYNLLNQGWTDDDIIQFELDKDRWPSNNLQWFVGKDDSGNYNTESLLKKYFGNTPAPKGHFIIDYFHEDRSNVSGIYGLSPHCVNYHHRDVWIRNRKLRADPVEQFHMDVYTPGTSEAEKQYFNTGTDKGEVLKSVVMHFTKIERKSAKKASDDMWHGKMHLVVYGVNTVDKLDREYFDSHKDYVSFRRTGVMPSGSRWLIEDYEEIHNEVIETYGASEKNPMAVRLQINNDKHYRYYRVTVSFDEGENTTSDIKYPIGVTCRSNFYMAGQDDSIFADTYKADTITDITYMPGRLFYLVNDTVLFSQVIKNNGSGFENCHQDADPTSEEISDILPTDGGYIKFNNIGVGRAIESFNRGVLVFGENIVYGLISPMEKAFSASDYDILELSRAGIIGDRSVVSTDSMVYYWSPMGIFRIGINPNTGSSIVAECITHSTIQEFYDRIPNESKETCRGCFDYVNNRIYWYYSEFEDDDESSINFYKLNRCLVLDLTNGSFMPFKIEGDEFITDVFNSKVAYEINPTMYLKAGEHRVIAGEEPVIAIEEDENFKRWTAIQHTISNTDGSFSFGDYNSREFKDFDKHEYDSYMVSRPIMFEGFSRYGKPLQDTAYDKQVPILQTLFKRTEQSPLTSAPAPVEHIYKLKDDVSYITDPNYDITSGTLSKHSIAKAFIFNDKGLFKSCKLRVDVKDFKGKNIDIAVELICDSNVEKTVKVLNKLVSSDYMDISLNESLDVPYENYVIRVVAEVRGGEVSNEKVHFTATFVQDRLSPLLPAFSGFKKIEVEDTERMYDVGDMFSEYALSVKLPSMYMTGFQIEAIPPKTLADESWNIVWDCKTDVNRNIFTEEIDYVSYGTSSKDDPIETAYDSSIQYVNKLSKVLKVGLKSYNYNRDDWKGLKVRYKVTGLVPQYETAETIKPKPNYIAASGANIRMRWGWSLTDKSNRWDMVQNGYRPQKDFMHDEYVESRMHVRGRGKAFQVEIRNNDNKDFRLAGMNLIVRSK